MVAGVLLAISFATYCLIFRDDPDAAFYFSAARFWELLAGCIAALVPRRDRPHGVAGNACAAMALAFLLFSYVNVNEESQAFPLALAMVVIAATALVWLGPSTIVARRLFASGPMVWIGLISYPLYLWHWPILAFQRIGAGTGAGDPTIAAKVLSIAAAVLLSWATFTLVERRVRFNRNRTVVPLLTGGLAGLGIVAVVILAMQGLPSRMTVFPAGANVLFQPYPHEQGNDACEGAAPGFSDFWSCTASHPAAPEIVLIGDSHANHYFSEISALTGRRVLELGEPWCLPFNGFDAASCATKQARVLTYLATLPSDTPVILSSYFSFLAAGGFLLPNIEGQRVARPLSEAAAAKTTADANDFLQRLTASGRPVYWIADVPDLVDRPHACVTVDRLLLAPLRKVKGRHLKTDGADCYLDRGAYEERIAPYDELESAILFAFPRIRFFAARQALCDHHYCYAAKDGDFLYWNSDHLTRKGAALVITAFLSSYPELAENP